MSEALQPRLATMTGLVVAATVALWWLGGTRLVLDDGSDASRIAADALYALWLARAMALALLGLRIGALRGWRPGVAAALGLMAPSWPVLVLAWSASATPWLQVVLAELLLWVAGAALPLLGLVLRRALRQAELALPIATVAGVALAASVWLARGLWTLPVG